MSDQPPRPPRSTRPSLSGQSGFMVPPSLEKHGQIIARHILWIDQTEDWKGRKSQQIYELERRQSVLEKKAHGYDMRRAEDRLWLEREFAKMNEAIKLVERDLKHTITVAIVAWIVLTTIVGLAARFI